MNGSLTITTNVTPPVTLDASAKGAGKSVLEFLKPTIKGDVSGIPFEYHPWGEASRYYGDFVIAGVVVLVAVGAWTIYRKVFR